MRATTLLLSVCCAVVVSGTATQTDWSGGAGILGPVSDWATAYHGGSNADATSIPGFVSLLPFGWAQPSMHYVDHYYPYGGCIETADLDGDGDIDVVCGSELNDRIDWWENSDTQPGTFVVQHTLDSSVDVPTSLFCVDLDADGDADVLGTTSGGSSDGIVAWWENNGTGSGWTRHTLVSNLHGGDGIHAADVDGDGDLDISAADMWNEDLLWFENLDSIGTSWARHVVFGSYDKPSSTYLGDIDGDGDTDFLAGGFGGVGWFENTDGVGSPPWTEHIVDVNFDFAIDLTALDFDGDGDSDILGAAYSGNALAWWENMDGSGGSFSRHDIATGYGAPGSAGVADFDLDGDLDVVSESFDEDNVTIWENLDGLGTLWRKNIIEPSYLNPGEACAADLDGDGDPDAICSAYTAGEIRWWEVCGEPVSGFIESSILDLGEDPLWGAIDLGTGWEGEFLVQVRASDDPENMGEWSDSLSFPLNLGGILTDGDSYFQYIVILMEESSSPAVLADVFLNWNLTGCEEGGGTTTTDLAIFPNPSRMSTSIHYSVTGIGAAEVSIFDLAGRLVLAMEPETDPDGNGNFIVTGLQPGIYFCRLEAGEIELNESFVILD